LSKIEKLNKEISSHFEEEIRLRKEILDLEKKIENLNLDLKEKEYDLYKIANSNLSLKDKVTGGRQKEIKTAVNKIQESIEASKLNINSKRTSLLDMESKRSDLKNNIAKFKDEPLSGSLNTTYQHYIVLLENLSLEYNKIQNNFNLKQKELKLNKLIDQIKLRDDLLSNAKNEMSKKGINFKHSEEVRPLENLNISSNLILPTVVNSKDSGLNPYTLKSFRGLSQNYSSNNLNSSRSKSPYEGYKNPNIVKTKKKFKSKITEIIDKVKKNELSDLKLNMINNLYPNSKIYYINAKNPNKKLNINQQNLITFDTRKLNNSFDKVNTSFNSVKSDLTRGREREIDKKVKNILINKNILTRHKNSPYLKNFGK
jgi:hypothetical protein